MNDLGMRAVHDLSLPGQQAKTKIRILAVRWPESDVEELPTDVAPPDQQRGARTVVNLSVIIVLGAVGVGKQADHAGDSIPIERAPGFLKAAVRIDDLRTDRTGIRMCIQH